MNNIADFMNVLLSSVVIVAIIELVMKNRNNHIEFITSRRENGRKDLRQIIANLCESSQYDKEAKKNLSLLKLNLNGYGKCSAGKYPDDLYLNIMKDQHIWKEIDMIEMDRGRIYRTYSKNK